MPWPAANADRGVPGAAEVARTGAAGWLLGIVAALGAAGLPLEAQAQRTSELITTALPYPDYRPVQDDHYGTRIGRVRMRYDLSFSAIYTDNAGYSAHGGESDLALEPLFTVGVFLPVSEVQTLQVDLGVGYDYWLNNDRRTQYILRVAPNSHLDYVMRVGEVKLRFANDSMTSSSATTRPEFAGGNSTTPVEFQSFYNTASLKASWAASQRLTFGGSYGFALTRSLTDQFTSLDRNTHQFGGSAMVQITTPVSAGLSANYSLFSYLERVQNDGQSFSVGPEIEWNLSKYLRVTLHGGYTSTTFDQTGSIADTSEFSGPTYGVSVQYDMNRYLKHRLSVDRSIDPGFGSNFTDLFAVRYGLQVPLGSKLSASLGFTYQQANQSGPAGDVGDLYTVNVGAGYQILSQVNLGLSYYYNLRDGATDLRSYTENRVVFTASYRF